MHVLARRVVSNKIGPMTQAAWLAKRPVLDLPQDEEVLLLLIVSILYQGCYNGVAIG